LAAELHLASIEAQQQKERDDVKKIATIGTVAVAAVGVAGIIAGALLSKK
jgi:hypothetical protein